MGRVIYLDPLIDLGVQLLSNRIHQNGVIGLKPKVLSIKVLPQRVAEHPDLIIHGVAYFYGGAVLILDDDGDLRIPGSHHASIVDIR